MTADGRAHDRNTHAYDPDDHGMRPSKSRRPA
jgi:hypothetical protein